MDLSPKYKTGEYRTLKRKTGRTLLDINHGKTFFDPPPRLMEIKTK